MPVPTLALADVHRVTTEIAGRETDVFIFDHHRTAFTLWSHVAQTLGEPLTLVTLDRHMDLGTPPALPPDYTSPLPVLDAFARHGLATSNDDHIVAALHAGAIGDAAVIARSHEPPSLQAFKPFVDHRGRAHHFAFSRFVSTVTPELLALVQDAKAIVLDIDLDCFTTRSDGHPDEVLTWDVDLIDAFLRPEDSEEFWRLVLGKTRVVTIAREPYHCGGFDRSARLWLSFAEVFFRRLLKVPAP